MILTPTTQKNLENLKTALRSSRAILVQGQVGSGKTASVTHLAESYGAKENMIQVNVDDSFDSKDLLGKFSATEVPGSFEWVPGPLTQAVKEGFWLLMEDIDLATFDVFSVLQSLLENGTLFLADKNLLIDAHPDFKLIATQQLYSSGATLLSRKSNSIPYAELWGTVILSNLSAVEECEIVRCLFPNVPESTTRELALLALKDRGAPLLNLSVLLKWARRVNRRLNNTNGATANNVATTRSSNDGNVFLSSTVREAMLREAYDCVVARYAPGFERDESLQLIASACGIPENVAIPLVQNAKPFEKLMPTCYSVGRVTLPLLSSHSGLARDSRIAFAPTAHAMSLLERLAAAVELNENILLTGETGVGKTFIVQYLADQLGQTLVVHNLNQQTDTSDFMGGWKPLDVGSAVRDLYTSFSDLFSQCFNAEKNITYLNTLLEAVGSRNWERSLRQMLKGCETFKLKHSKTPCDEMVVETWQNFEQKCGEVFDSVVNARTNFAFTYEEGSLVKAWREGHWILLDELNLASTDVLERVSSVLGDVDKLFLTDKGSIESVPKHPNFHVFANMNPPTDVGKKDLPPSLRSRFTECYVSEPFNENDIRIVVKEYVGFLTPDAKVDEITKFFLDCVENAKAKLCSLDGESKPPSFSLRTLTRALSYVRRATPLYGYTVSLFDGLLLGFATPLQRQFHAVVEQLIVKNVFAGRRPSKPSLPQAPPNGKHIAYEHMWIEAGDEEAIEDSSFILTESVRGHLANLARAVFANRPVLLEGPTSSGKSSLVKYLAELTGNKFVRINNHDSTEVQEYLGSYVTDEFGKLRFVDGILVNAVRHGHWVVLDELNLAPTDVLEALNRLLDDNCELFIPDTQETIRPHPHLRIFATQNPAGVYGGRKMLSRAFRNRFLEITVDEIPTSEVSTILQQRFRLPSSFSEKMVEVMTALQIRRQNSQIFAGRHGFITPRDLFRWAERKPSTFQELAEHGFLLLGERCRRPTERQVVKDVIEKVTKTEIIERDLYSPEHWPFVKKYYATVEDGLIEDYKIVWTESMQRLFTIVGICLENEEPVLLVGETGSSKTTVCQLWAALLRIPLRIVNCHQHTEAADFLGSLRPVPPDRRENALFEWRNGPLVQSMIDGDFFVLDEISLAEDSVLERLNSVLEPSRSITLAEKSSGDMIVASASFRVMATMNPGGDFGKKELSPALRNRFSEVYVRPTTAHEEVTQIISKRLHPELSHWASSMADVLCGVSEVTSSSGAPQHISIRDIISWVLFMNAADTHCPAAVGFLQGLDAVILDGIGVGTGLSESSADAVRRICVAKSRASCPDADAFSEKPFWTFFEGMAEPKLPIEMESRFFFGAPATRRNLSKLMRASIVKKAVLLEGSPGVGKTSIVEALGCALNKSVVRVNLSEQTDIMDLFGTYLPCARDPESQALDTEADGNAADATSDSTDAAAQMGEQHDDKAEGATATCQGGPEFAWSDGILLRALKEGSWVILDELNLASQAVLEGLNALLDHRSSVFIPELNKEFHAHESFRVFACQNPVVEGGGRKGLPRSFLNRFMRVHVEAFETDDLICIAKAVCHGIDEEVLARMVNFVGYMQDEVMVRRSFGLRGSPWEFNLRDVLRWAKAMKVYNEEGNPTFFADTLFIQRMRTDEDRRRCRQALEKHFDSPVDIPDARNSDFLLSDDGQTVHFQCRRLLTRRHDSVTPSSLTEKQHRDLLLLPSQASIVKSLLMCAELNQFALLIGPSGAGKTFALHAAAALAGAKLVTFSMNASCDTVDLLGGFDQVEGKEGKFEWRDSLIVEAILRGYWLVLDNVNYCNASVLDRLNPLVEPNGVLSINEQGLVDDDVRVICPHPQFRLFATLNPKLGEISRAMRNRATELFLAPVAVPSAEAAVLSRSTVKTESMDEWRRAELVTEPCADAAEEGAARGESETVAIEKLSRFHQRFVSEAFGGANTAEPAAAVLSDALASGAPNTFTLLRASGMLLRCEESGSVALSRTEEEEAAGNASPSLPTKSRLAHVIEHCYLDNRSGHWRHKMSALQDTLEQLVALTPDQMADDTRAPLSAMSEAFTLHSSAGAIPDGVEGHSADVDALSLALSEKRVLRGALPLLVRPIHAGATEGAEATSFAARHFCDLLLYFVLDQIHDSIPSPVLVDARKRCLSWCIPLARRLLSSTAPMDRHSTMSLAERAASVIDSSYSFLAALPILYCRASLAIGPHAETLAALADCNSQLSDSGLVNATFTALIRQLYSCVARMTSPILWHRLAALLESLATALRGPISADNYIPVATHGLLLYSVILAEPQHLKDNGASILPKQFTEFFEGLQRYLALPFSLLASGESVLHKCVPHPRITTADERVTLSQWRQLASASTTKEEMTASTPGRLLSALWHSAAFRTEYVATQALLTTVLHFPCLSASSANAEEASTRVSYTSELSELQEAVSHLLKLYGRKRIGAPTDVAALGGNEMELTLWRQTLSVDRNTAENVLGQCAPLLVSRFATRFGLEGTQHLFGGSWAAAAVRCLQYAGRATVLQIGSGSSNDHVLALNGLRDFLSSCPVTSHVFLETWTANARTQLRRILSSCFSGLPFAGAAGIWIDESAFPNGVTHEALRSAMDPSVQTCLEKHLPLFVPLFSLLMKHGSQKDATPGECASISFAAIALLWVLKCRLLLPQSPIDPMFKRKLDIQSTEQEDLLLSRLESAFAWADDVVLRSYTDSRGLLAELRDELTRHAALSKSAYVERPENSGKHYASLVGKLYSLTATHFNEDRLSSILPLTGLGVLSGAGTAEGRKACSERVTACSNWCELVFQEVVEILHQYSGYEDVTLNFAEAALLATMAAKASCLSCSERVGGGEQASGTLFSPRQTVQLLQFPGPLTEIAIPRGPKDRLRRRGVGGPQMRHLLTYLDGCLRGLYGSVPQGTDRESVEGVFAAYRDLYRSVEELEVQEKREEEMSVLYKEKALVIEGDDEKLLGKLRSLFPSYENEFTTDDEDVVSDGSVTALDHEARTARLARVMFKEDDSAFVRRLVNAHGDFYRRLVADRLDNGRITAKLLVSAFTCRFDTLSGELSRFQSTRDTLGSAAFPLLPTLDEHTAQEEQLLLNGFAARAAVLRQQLDTTSSGVDASEKEQSSLQSHQASGFNIYRDADPVELGRFSKPLGRLLAAAQSLSERYPDTVSLQRCLRIGRKIAALPALTTPLMKVVAGCEVLLRECYEWERNAAQSVSLMTHMTELSSFVLRWRRLELHCWQHVFKAKREEYELSASLEWFALYDLVRGTAADEVDLEDATAVKQEDTEEATANSMTSRCGKLFQRLFQFLWGSCFGDFAARLQLTRNLGCELLASHGPFSPLTTTALHTADFFSQFESLVRTKTDEAIRPIEDDVKDFAKIMRWEDANYYAVRATSEKSHLKMARALGALEDALRTPVLSVISAEEQRCEDDAAMGFTPAATPKPHRAGKGPKATDRRKGGAADSKTSEASGKRKRSGKKVAAAGTGAGGDGAEETAAESSTPSDALRWHVQDVCAAFEFFHDSSLEVIHRVKTLQAPKTPNQLKVRALKGLFDTLSEFGVSHTHESQAQPWEVLFASTEALAVARATSNNAEALSDGNSVLLSAGGPATGPAPTKSGKKVQELPVDGATGATQQHYRFARWLQRMREAERKPHHDLSAAQVKRATGLVETLFADSVETTELACVLHTLRRHLGSLSVYATELGDEDSGDHSPSLPMVWRDEALDEALRLCCAAQALHASLQWIDQKGLVPHGSDAVVRLGDQDNSSARSAVQQMGAKCHDLWSLCVRYEPLRRAGASLPAAAAQRMLDETRQLHASLERLASCGHPQIAAAASGCAVQFTAFLSSLTIQDGDGGASDHEADKKRRRLELEPATAPNDAGSWHKHTLAALERLHCALSTDAETIVPASPVALSGTDDRPSKTDDYTETDQGDASKEYGRYRDRLTAVKQAAEECSRTLANLLTAPAAATSLGAGKENRSVHQDVLRILALCTASASAVEQSVLAVATSHGEFGVVLSRLFTVLIKKGFCKTEGDDEENEEGGEGEGGLQNGTGMDDGEGEKDVTNEIENEDQLMNMKDKETPEDEENGDKQKEKDNGDGDEEDEEDNAADVETDFQAKKEHRSESDKDEDDSGEGEDESDQEMGSVDGDEERDRKKMRKDKSDANDMDEDEGDAAEEVPEDEFGNEQDEKPDDENGEETGGFDDKENEIREAEKERDGEHELAGLDDKSLASDADGNEDDGEDDSSNEGYTSQSESASDKGAETDENAGDGEEDDNLDKNDEEDDMGSEGGSKDREDDSASTDSDRTPFGEQEQRENNEEGSDDDDDASNVEDARDGKDENVFEGGIQDEETGEEATERKDTDDDDKSKPPKNTKQPDTFGNEEEQAGDEQEQDDAGRNWKKQQEQNEAAQQRKDNTDDRSRAEQHNPYRAIKEALKRHQRQVQQLNLNQKVEVKRTNEAEKDSKVKDDEAADDVDEEPSKDDVAEFDFDEKGDREGLAATDETNQEDGQHMPPTEAEADLDERKSDRNSDGAEEEDEEDGMESAPKDRRRKRDKQTDNLTEVKEVDEDEDEKSSKKPTKNSKVTARRRNDSSSSDEDSDSTEQQPDAEEAAQGADAKLERGRKLWQEQETAVQGLSQQLCEQLRLILAPTLADKLQGDYKTGKRLNMKRIIPYIASQFKKDRIWLRRTKPNKRTYQIMVALDDSLSMQCNDAGVLSCRAVALIAKALQQLEVGEIGITCFGKEATVVHGLEEPFAADSGPRAFSEITFQQSSTNMRLFLESTLDYLDSARERAGSTTRSTTQQLQQVLFIISDGQITEDRGELRKLLVRAEENHQMVVFVLLDIKATGADAPNAGAASAAADGAAAPALPSSSLSAADLKGLSTAERMRRLKAERESRLKRVQSNSVLDMQIVEFKQGKVLRRSYMEDFPFPYYLIVHDLQNLPEVIADAMRQWFELLNAGQ